MDVVRQVLGELDGHDCRMENAAVLGKSGEAGKHLEGLGGAEPWVGMYGVVMAMAARESKPLLDVIRNSRSFSLQVRAVMALSKFNQEATLGLYLAPSTPKQLKHVVIKTLTHATPPAIEAVLNNKDLGPWGAILLLKKLTPSAQHEALVRANLTRLAEMTNMQRGDESQFPRRVWGKCDLGSVYQSLASKYPTYMLELLQQSTLTPVWRRAVVCLAGSHTTTVLGNLKSLIQSKAASGTIDMFARPLLKHALHDTVQMLVAHSHAAPSTLAHCLKCSAHDNVCRGIILEVLSTEGCKLAREMGKKYLARLINQLVKLLAKGVKSHPIADILVSLLGENTGCSYSEFVRIHGLFKGDRFAPSAAAVLQLVRGELERKQFNPRCVVEDELLMSAFRQCCLDMQWVVRDVLSHVGEVVHVPHTALMECSREVVAHADYSDMKTEMRCSYLKHMSIEETEKMLKEMLNVRTPSTRVEVMEAMWTSLSHSDDARKGAVLQFLTLRLHKEEVSVKQPVVQHILSTVMPIERFTPDVLPDLEVLFGYSLKWGNGLWMDAWATWSARVTFHHRSLKLTTFTCANSRKMVAFAKQTIKRILDAEALVHTDIVRCMREAAKCFEPLTHAQWELLGKEAAIHVSEIVKATRSSRFYVRHSVFTSVHGAATGDLLFTEAVLPLVQGMLSVDMDEYDAECFLRYDHGEAEKFYEWTFWVELAVLAVEVLPTAKYQMMLTYAKWLPVAKADLDKVAAAVPPEEKFDAVSRHFGSYRPVLSRICEVSKQKVASIYDDPDHEFLAIIIAGLEYFSCLEVGVEASVDMVVRYGGSQKVAGIIRLIGKPTPATEDVFTYAVDHLKPHSAREINEALQLIPTCFEGREVALKDPRLLRYKKPAKRYRYKGERAEVDAAESDEAEFAKGGAAITKLVSRMKFRKETDDAMIDVLSHLMSRKECYSARRATILELLYAVNRRPRVIFRIPDMAPEIPALVAMHATEPTCEYAVRSLLSNPTQRPHRLRALLNDGMLNLSPQLVFLHSSTFQEYIFRYFPEYVPGLLKGNETCSLEGLVTEASCVRYAGQTCEVKWFVKTLPPAVQQYLMKEWVLPFAFNTEEGGIGGEDDHSNEDTVTHHNEKARRLAVGVELASCGHPPLTDALHPFNVFFARVLDERNHAETLRHTEKDTVEKSFTHSCALLCSARGGLLSQHLLSALRSTDTPLEALRVVVQHIDGGTASKSAIPSAVCLLRTVPVDVAAGMLRSMLCDDKVKVAAKTQLSRLCVELLPPDEVYTMATALWADAESWTFVGSEAAQPAQSVKEALLCAIVTSPHVSDPSVWGLVASLSPDTESDLYAARKVIEMLAGVHTVRTVNAQFWPLAAPPSLASLVASFYDVAAIRPHASIALTRWFKMLAHTHCELPSDVLDSVVDRLQGSNNVELLVAMVEGLSKRRAGMFSDVLEHHVKALQHAAKSRAVNKISAEKQILTQLCSTPMSLEKPTYIEAGVVLGKCRLVAELGLSPIICAPYGVEGRVRMLAEVMERMGEWIVPKLFNLPERSQVEPVEVLLVIAACKRAGTYEKCALAYFTGRALRLKTPHVGQLCEYLADLTADPHPAVSRAAVTSLDHVPRHVFRMRLDTEGEYYH